MIRGASAICCLLLLCSSAVPDSVSELDGWQTLDALWQTLSSELTLLQQLSADQQRNLQSLRASSQTLASELTTLSSELANSQQQSQTLSAELMQLSDALAASVTESEQLRIEQEQSEQALTELSTSLQRAQSSLGSYRRSAMRNGWMAAGAGLVIGALLMWAVLATGA